MKPANFQYHAPRSLPEALELVSGYGDEAKALAGGQSLVPILALRLTRFAHLVDLNQVAELAHITREQEWLSVGAMTRQSAVEGSAAVARDVPLLARAVPLIGHFQIRNRGTIGGSIAHADPASELPAVASALGAEIEVAGPGGRRRVPAHDFFRSIWETAIEPDELCVAVNFPRAAPRSGFAIKELALRLGDFAIAGCAAALRLDAGGRVEDAGIALMGMGPTPLRADRAEAALRGMVPTAADFEAAAALAVEDSAPSDDVHAPASYRRRVARALTTTALRSAYEEANRG